MIEGSLRRRIIVFQSSPLSQEGRYPRAFVENVEGLVFQSSPLSQEGRYCHAADILPFFNCFNPRPSRKRGATFHLLATLWSPDVSILAPLARGALPPRWKKFTSPSRVSILAPLARGALPIARRGRSARATRFNPRPSRKRGATP